MGISHSLCSGVSPSESQLIHAVVVQPRPIVKPLMQTSTETFVLPPIILRDEDKKLAIFEMGALPLAVGSPWFSVSNDKMSIVVKRSGTLTLSITEQLNVSTGTLPVLMQVLLNDRPIDNDPTSLLRFYWPAFVTGYEDVASIVVALEVKVGDRVSLLLVSQPISTSQRPARADIGGPGSFAVLELAACQVPPCDCHF